MPYLRGSGQQRRLKGARRQPPGDWQGRDDEQPEGERRPRSALHLGQAGGGRRAAGFGGGAAGRRGPSWPEGRGLSEGRGLEGRGGGGETAGRDPEGSESCGGLGLGAANQRSGAGSSQQKV